MADIVSGSVTGFVNNYPEATTAALSDIRREGAEHTNEIVKEGLKGDYATQGAIKDTRFDVNSRLSTLSTEVANRFFDVGRDTQDIRAQIISAQQGMVAGFLGAQKDAEINALKTQVELSKQSTYLSDKIDAGNSKTQDLINSLKEHDLNRALIERNAELVGALEHGRHWRGRYYDGQFQSLASNMQNFQSQLSETRQGLVNFGTMSGGAGQQTSTSNNVR
jgi:hypothetical protein